jgi:hypothetical protein
MMDDLDRMLICDVCGADACCGSGVTVDGIRMGDVGSWRCAEHHPDRKPRYSREQWAEARSEGRLYPESPAGEWQQLGDITNRLLQTWARQIDPPAPTEEAAE